MREKIKGFCVNIYRVIVALGEARVMIYPQIGVKNSGLKIYPHTRLIFLTHNNYPFNFSDPLHSYQAGP